jgi:sigma-B regulation protein RsbU (phosphoserine phosphatase)
VGPEPDGDGAARRDFDAALLADDAEAPYDRAPCAYVSTTPDGVVVKVNQTFLAWTGLTREELVGRRRFAELLGPGGRIYHETHFAPMLRLQGSVREMALDVKRADGVLLPVVVNAVLERGHDGAPLIVRVAMFDATERRQFERELVLARRTAEEAETRALALARTLQQTLIPPQPPRIPGLEVAAVYRPAGDGAEVGGDFYDVYQVGDDWVVVLGDVSGKGVDAAVVTSLIRYAGRGIAARVTDPSEVLYELNDVLRAHDTDRFCTVAMLRLSHDDDGWQVLASFGGHPPALLRGPSGSVSALGTPGSRVGILDDVAFTTARVRLSPGDTLVLYTDGVTDAQRDVEHFGEERTTARVASLGPDPTALTRGLVDEVVDYQRGRPRDDIAVLAVAVPATG